MSFLSLINMVLFFIIFLPLFSFLPSFLPPFSPTRFIISNMILSLFPQKLKVGVNWHPPHPQGPAAPAHAPPSPPSHQLWVGAVFILFYSTLFNLSFSSSFPHLPPFIYPNPFCHTLPHCSSLIISHQAFSYHSSFSLMHIPTVFILHPHSPFFFFLSITFSRV